MGEGSEASYALNVLGNVALASGDPATARARYGEALESARAIASPRWIAGSLMNFGFLAFQLSLHDEAQEHWDAALALFMASGEALMATRVRGNLAFLELTRGRHAQARDLIAAMLPVLQESGDVAALAPAHLNMGRALAGLDDPDGALSHYTKAIDSACEMGNRPIEGSALLGRARVVAARGRLDEAREDLRASLAALSSSARTEATDLVQLAETLRAAGLHDEALACAARLSEQLGGVPAMARAAMRLRGEALEDKGDLSGAIEAYSELRDLAARGSAGDEASYASRAIDRCRAAGGSDLTNPGQPSS
ncbi:MAG: tetratricopeptide repeat protein [Acidobacteriota bacterium]